MNGSRTSLCRVFFSLWDEAAAAKKPFLGLSAFPLIVFPLIVFFLGLAMLRLKFMVLENVSNILSVDLQDVMKFLLQDNFMIVYDHDQATKFCVIHKGLVWFEAWCVFHM